VKTIDQQSQGREKLRLASRFRFALSLAPTFVGLEIRFRAQKRGKTFGLSRSYEIVDLWKKQKKIGNFKSP
jgi:ribosomal protein L9